MSVVHHFAGPLVGSGSSDTTTLYASGPGVLHFIAVGFDDTVSASTDIDVEVLDGDDAVIHYFQVDPTSNRPPRGGLYCGPYGIRSTNGLKVRVTNRDGTNTGIKLTYLYGPGYQHALDAPSSSIFTGFSTHTAEAAGTKGTLSHVHFRGTNTNVVVEARQHDGTVLAVWQGDSVDVANQRTGYYCGPFGMDFNDGLVFEIKDNGGGGGSATLYASIHQRA